MHKERRLKTMFFGLFIFTVSLALIGCNSGAATQTADPVTNNEAVDEEANPDVEAVTEEAIPESNNESIASVLTTFKLDAWADNWFAVYLDDILIVEDSVPIRTERSFNAETATFEASYPLYLNFILKDFKENDTGLEYIGEGNQQMGDGGFIMQLTDMASGQIVAVSNGSWACTVIHEAPLDKSCESETNPSAGAAPCDYISQDEPVDWMGVDFDDSAWGNATVYSVNDVRPKDGYDQISWDSNAELIWGPDLETSNTILCRVTVND